MIRNIRLLYLHNFLTDFRFQEAFLVIWFAQIMGSYTAAMTVLALGTITSAIMDIPAGIFSDRLGRKYTLILSSACTTLMVVCFAFATNAYWLYVGGIFYGLAQCLFNGNNDALLYETLKTEKKEGRFHHFQGRAKSMYQLALCLSAFGASLLTAHGLRLVFMLGIVPQVLSFFVASVFYRAENSYRAREKPAGAFKESLCSDLAQSALAADHDRAGDQLWGWRVELLFQKRLCEYALAQLGSGNISRA